MSQRRRVIKLANRVQSERGIEVQITVAYRIDKNLTAVNQTHLSHPHSLNPLNARSAKIVLTLSASQEFLVVAVMQVIAKDNLNFPRSQSESIRELLAMAKSAKIREVDII